MADASKPPVQLDTKSTLLEKLPADLRRRLDQAIADRDPPTYQAAYDKFNLAAHNVSFTAFYTYARRLRALAEMARVAELTAPGAPDLAVALPTLLAYRLLDAAADEAASTRKLHRLADAWRIIVRTQLASQRQAANIDEDQRKQRKQDADALHDALHKYTRFVADQRKLDDPKFKEMLASLQRGDSAG